MKRKIKIILLSILVAAIVIAFAVVMVLMIKENGKCVDKPFEYASMRLKQGGGNYTCYCVSNDPKLLDFTFNESGITILPISSFFQKS